MSLNMFWFLPTHGDGHYLGTEEGSRPVDHGYLQQIAQAADRLGYTGVRHSQWGDRAKTRGWWRRR